MKERIYTFDNVKVWLMIMVVLGHTLIASYGSSNTIVSYLWFFRGIYTMPLFFFISGFFAKPTGTNLKKLCKSVLLPFIIFDIFYMFYESLCNGNYTANWTVPSFAMWFLLVLFIYRLIFPLIIKVKFALPISILMALIAGFFPFINARFALSRVFCFLPFFLLGYYVNNDAFFSKIRKKLFEPFNLKDTVPLLCIVVFWGFVLYFRPNWAFLTTFTQSYGENWGGQLLVRISLYATAVFVGYYVLKMFPNRKTFYTKYGGRTMGVYLLHGLVVLPSAYMIFRPFEYESNVHRILMIVLPVLISLLFFARPIDNLIKKIF